MGYLSGYINFKNSIIDVQFSPENFNIPRERNLVLLVPFFKRMIIIFRKVRFFQYISLLLMNLKICLPYILLVELKHRIFCDFLWLSVSLSGNIFPETPSGAQQSIAADICATLAQSFPKLPKSHQEEKKKRTTKMPNN